MTEQANQGYLYGVFISDGSVFSYPERKKYGAKLTVKDVDFALKFKEELEKYLGEEININKHKATKVDKKYIRVITQKKENYKKTKELLQKDVNSFKNKDVLKGIFDGEGSVTVSWRNLSPELTIRIVQGKYRKEAETVIENSNLHYTKTEKDGNDTYHFRGQHGVALWHYLGGFTIHRKDIQVKAYQELKKFMEKNYEKRPSPENFNLETQELTYDNWR